MYMYKPSIYMYFIYSKDQWWDEGHDENKTKDTYS